MTIELYPHWKNISKDTWDGSIHERVDLLLKPYSFVFAERGFLHLVGQAASSRPLKTCNHLHAWQTASKPKDLICFKRGREGVLGI